MENALRYKKRRTTIWLGEECIRQRNCPSMTTTVSSVADVWVTVTITSGSTLTSTKHTKSTISASSSTSSSTSGFPSPSSFSSTTASYSSSSLSITTASILPTSSLLITLSSTPSSLIAIQPPPSFSPDPVGGIGQNPRKAPVALIASTVSITAFLIVGLIITFFLLRRRRVNSEIQYPQLSPVKKLSFTSRSNIQSLRRLNFFSPTALFGIFHQKRYGQDDTKLVNDETLLLTKPERAYTHRKYPSSNSARLHEKVARFYTPEVHQMMQRLPDKEGNEFSVKVDVGDNRPPANSSSRSSRSWRWSKLGRSDHI